MCTLQKIKCHSDTIFWCQLTVKLALFKFGVKIIGVTVTLKIGATAML